MRESVQWFAGQMEKELAKHDEDRGEGWKKDGVLRLFHHLRREVDELESAVTEAVESGEIDQEKVIGECADVGNLAMMVADVTRAVKP